MMQLTRTRLTGRARSFLQAGQKLLHLADGRGLVVLQPNHFA